MNDTNTSLTESRTSHAPRAQSLAMCLPAELRRILYKPSSYVLLLIPILLASGVIFGVVAFMITQGLASDVMESVPTAVSVACFLMAIVLGIGILTTVSREMNDGTVATSLLLVPDRLRLLLSRSLSYVIITAVATLAWLATVELVVLAILKWNGGLVAPLTSIVLCATLATVLSVLMMVLLVTIVPSGAISLAIVFLFNVILPLGLGIVVQISHGSWLAVLGKLTDVLPGTLLSLAMDPVNASHAVVVRSFAGLTAWCAALFAGAYYKIRKFG